MLAISLWEPWATAIALGAKTIETRHWHTTYRGPLLIHAAKRLNKSELIYLNACWNWCGIFSPLGVAMGGKVKLVDVLNFGKIVAICDMTDCRPTSSFTGFELDSPRRPAGCKDDRYDFIERQLGDFSNGRYGWLLRNVRAIKPEIPFKGKQGFFHIPDSLLAEAAPNIHTEVHYGS